ncbi:serine hydrolase [Candidatus Poriferisocius sp.]|uniref:serine hydrolase n=1 Tax=Candidatus Poriferisocius sp. TaxID=3101276 RepID=UPI003B5B6799
MPEAGSIQEEREVISSSSTPSKRSSNSIGSDALLMATEEALQDVVDEGIFAVGGQAAVVTDGLLAVNVAVGAAGNGKPLVPESLHNVFCTLKPVAYLLLAHALERSGCGPDDELDSITVVPRWCPDGLTLRSLGTHQAGLIEPRPMPWKWTPPEKRQKLLEQSQTSRDPGYSDLAGGLVAEHVIEQLSGRTATEYCSEELLQPLELEDEVIFDAEAGWKAHHRIQAPVSGLPIDKLPMLSELLPSHIGEVRLAMGALATMRGAAEFYAAVGNVMAGKPQPGMPSPRLLQDLLNDDRPITHDPVLGRPAKWSGGLMVELGQQGISQIAGKGSVGHTGAMANSVAIYDPTKSASVAIYLNGVGSSLEDQVLPRQQALDKILNAIPASP